MAHYQQATFNIQDGVDKLNLEEIMDEGAFIRFGSDTEISVMLDASKMNAFRNKFKQGGYLTDKPESVADAQRAVGEEMKKPAAPPAAPQSATPAKPAAPQAPPSS